ncbi:MAG: SPOR domain-containing protein, partial [Deltaproteobacteria bacterium]|nr:SPOR domain-containing protein [Deltaproteobacteria bacterium]
PYAVYIESFTDRKALETEMTTLRHNSYSTYIISDEDYNSLFTGVFITKRGAEELSAELTALGISNRVVLR